MERDATRSDSPARVEPGLEDATPSESIAEQRVPGHLRTNWGARPRAADLVRLIAKITDSPSLLQGAIEDLREIVGERVVREFQAFEEGVSRRLTELEKRFDSLETGLTDRMDRHMENVNGQFATVRAEFNGQSSELRSEFNDLLDALKSDLVGRMEALRSDLKGSIRLLKSNFNNGFESQNAGLTSDLNAPIHGVLKEIRLFRRDLRIAVVLALIFYAIVFYDLYSERPKPQIIVVHAAQWVQLDTSRELGSSGVSVRFQPKKAERNDSNVVPDAEDPPSPTGPE